jgi:hypothetical protein
MVNRKDTRGSCGKQNFCRTVAINKFLILTSVINSETTFLITLMLIVLSILKR